VRPVLGDLATSGTDDPRLAPKLGDG
jgi:hypothetical protein